MATSRPVPPPIRLPIPTPASPPSTAPTPVWWEVGISVGMICSILPWRIVIDACCEPGAAHAVSERAIANAANREKRRTFMDWNSGTGWKKSELIWLGEENRRQVSREGAAPLQSLQ